MHVTEHTVGCVHREEIDCNQTVVIDAKADAELRSARRGFDNFDKVFLHKSAKSVDERRECIEHVLHDAVDLVAEQVGDVKRGQSHRIAEHVENEPGKRALGHAVFVHLPSVLVEAVLDFYTVAVLIGDRARVFKLAAVRFELFDEFGIVELIQAVAVLGVSESARSVVRALSVGPALVEDKTQDDRHCHTTAHLCVKKKRIVIGEISVLVEAVVVLLEESFKSGIVEAFFQHAFIIVIRVDIIEYGKRDRTSCDVVVEAEVVVVEDVLIVDELVKLILSRIGFESVDFNLNTVDARLFVRLFVGLHSFVYERIFVFDDFAVVLGVRDESFVGEISVFGNLAVCAVVVEVAVEKVVHDEISLECGILFRLLFSVVVQIFAIKRALRRKCDDVGENIGQYKTEARRQAHECDKNFHRFGADTAF